MLLNFLSALGGVGLFLIGMLLLTDGLKALAGRHMREVLAGFTSTPLSGVATGAVTTAVIQSSSATTVAAVGFVASGLLTFPQALGVIFGANIGTTATGWLVAILGFKLDLGQVALPFVFLGAFLRIAFRGRIGLTGQAIAGFCLIFLGIEYMKDGLEAFEGVVTPTDFPPDTVAGRMQLVVIGALITAVTQSSSAGVAAALAALGAGAINFPQAAALVIGMNVGTTFTAVLATVGGGTMARRTGYSHVIYNVTTGIIALFLLGPFQSLVGPWLGKGDGQIALVAFHSAFNMLGVALILPFTRPFARLVELLVPQKGDDLTRSLDPLVLREPRVALGLAKQTVERISLAMSEHLRRKLGRSAVTGKAYEKDDLETAIRETRDYLYQAEVPKDDTELLDQVKNMFHILDHLGRLLYRCDQSARIKELSNDKRLKRLAVLLDEAARRHADPEDPKSCEVHLDRLRGMMRKQRKIWRERLITEAAIDTESAETVWGRLDALRWLHRVTYHLWRIRLHLNTLSVVDGGVTSSVEEARIDIAQD
ncbi:Na/Pi cotransporter family protein [Roseibium sp.]|uniref:Na/Pi cotransporter family protein n=1 Tax=Roseibium sp. TaxID=1936156 RepID=UPI003D0E528E